MKDISAQARSPLFALLVILTALPATGLSACNLESVPQALVILANQVPETGCVVTAGGGASKIRSQGQLDLSIGRSYSGYLQVENLFPELTELTSFEGEDIRLDGAAVSLQALEIVHRLPAEVLSDAGFQTALTELNVPAPGSTLTVPISGAVLPGESTVAVGELIPANLGQALRNFSGLALGVEVGLVVEVVASGVRGDGSVVKSGTFFYPISLCNNCLVAGDSLQSVVEAPSEDDLAADTIFAYGEVCEIGADVAVSNLFCSLFRPGSASADDCKFNRCLGSVAGTLQCPSDGQALPAPVVIE